MTLLLDPTPRDADGAPLDPVEQPHFLTIDRDGDGWNEPHSEFHSCSCGHPVSGWVQSDPEHSDKPLEEDVFAAHAAHVAQVHAEEAEEAQRFVAALAGAAAWMRDLAVDGPDLIATAHLKTVSEAQEVAEQPHDIVETADVAICLSAVVEQQGWTLGQVTGAIEEKTARNRLRQWAQQPNGTWQHVRTTTRTEDPATSDQDDPLGHTA